MTSEWKANENALQTYSNCHITFLYVVSPSRISVGSDKRTPLKSLIGGGACDYDIKHPELQYYGYFIDDGYDLKFVIKAIFQVL